MKDIIIKQKMEKSHDSSKKTVAVKPKAAVKPKPPSGQYITEGKKIPTKKKPVVKKITLKTPVKKTIPKKLVKKAPIKKTAGRKPQIDKVLEKLKKKKIHLLQIYRIEMLTSITGVGGRTLRSYLGKGIADEEAGIGPWDGKRRKGSKYVLFLHIIQQGQNNAEMAASLNIRHAIEQRSNPQYAFKYLAIRFPELWAEKVRLEHSGRIDSEATLTVRQIHEYAERARKNKSK